MPAPEVGMRMINLGGTEVRLKVKVEAGASFEFLASLGAFGAPSAWPALDLGDEAFRRLETSPPPGFAEAWNRVGRDAGQIWLSLLPMAHDSGPPWSVSGLISHLRKLSGVELRRYLLGYYLPSHAVKADREVIDAAARGDEEAVRFLSRDRMYYDGEADQLAGVLALDVKTTKALVIKVMESWNKAFFAEHEKAYLPALERDAEAKALLLETTTTDRAIEMATGIVCEPMPGLVDLILIPQFAYRPWNVFVQRGELGVWCYPMADESLAQDPGAPPRQLVRLVKAIADEKRLRILRALSEKDSSLQELTESLKMPKSTVHHHLLALRAAGLVRMTPEPNIRYILRREALAEPSALLGAFLREPSS